MSDHQIMYSVGIVASGDEQRVALSLHSQDSKSYTTLVMGKGACNTLIHMLIIANDSMEDEDAKP